MIKYKQFRYFIRFVREITGLIQITSKYIHAFEQIHITYSQLLFFFNKEIRSIVYTGLGKCPAKL
jgi:hypothetical protein